MDNPLVRQQPYSPGVPPSRAFFEAEIMKRLALQGKKFISNAFNKKERPPTRVSYESSPISVLHHDILLQIFHMNANMEDDHPVCFRDDPKAPLRDINVTRVSSQVCFLWRDLIVNTPILWASVIDLPLLDRAEQSWREEVFRRTQSAPLHVKGFIRLITLDEPNGPWWLHFFNANWSRIRIFDAYLLNEQGMQGLLHRFVFSPDEQSRRHRTALPFLSRPAPTLEYFKLGLVEPCDPMDVGALIFDSHAPQLRSFEIRNWPTCLVPDQPYPWFSQLQNLAVLSCKNKTFASLDVFYQLFSQIPRIRRFLLTDAIVVPFIESGRVPLDCPWLSRIEIRSTQSRASPDASTTVCWQALNFITPKPGCSILISTCSLPRRDIPLAASVFAKYAANYFKHSSHKILLLTSSPWLFRVADLPFHDRRCGASVDLTWYTKPFIDLTINFTRFDSRPTDDRMYPLLTRMFPLSFPFAVDLTLHVAVAHSAAFADPRFIKLLSSFSSVETLTTTHPTLHSLIHTPAVNLPALFPRVKELGTYEPYLNVTSSDASFYGPEFDAKGLLTTFRDRIARDGVGIQLSTLDSGPQLRAGN